MIRQLPPWHANLKKRQVKAPKIYFRDTSLLHSCLDPFGAGVVEPSQMWCVLEGYVIEETLKALEPDEAWFWATHNGAEIDLILLKDGHRLGVECKRVDAPRLTPSMRIALEDLKLERIAVVYPEPAVSIGGAGRGGSAGCGGGWDGRVVFQWIIMSYGELNYRSSCPESSSC